MASITESLAFVYVLFCLYVLIHYNFFPSSPSGKAFTKFMMNPKLPKLMLNIQSLIFLTLVNTVVPVYCCNLLKFSPPMNPRHHVSLAYFLSENALSVSFIGFTFNIHYHMLVFSEILSLILLHFSVYTLPGIISSDSFY